MKRTPLRKDGPATLKVPALKPRKCSKAKGGCGETFTPRRAMQCACGPACAINFAALANAKKAAKQASEDRKAHRKALEATRSLSWWAGKAQEEVNRYVRLRDVGLPCISCGTTTAEEWHAGHYLSRGARPELRYHLDNIHLQCMQCNYFGAGMQAAYRVNLVQRIGLARVEVLEGPHPPLKLTRERCAEIRDEYRAKASELNK